MLQNEPLDEEDVEQIEKSRKVKSHDSPKPIWKDAEKSRRLLQ